ncbi:MAG: hypothetical protein ACKVZJ_15525 [Phycisphaerales bacterium]
MARCALAATLALTGCVTEVVNKKPQGTPTQRLTGGTIAPRDTNQPPRPLPEGPVAAPAKPTATIESRVVVAVRPMGTIPFDGQTLPLVSPDGRYLATQVGEPPAWSTVFASFTRTPSTPRCTVHIYDLTGETPQRLNVTPPPALLLGRDADNLGVLVESPQPDGSRHIGRLNWSGELEWLINDDRVNAHAVFIPGGGGGLAYTRRDINAERSELVIRSASGDEWTRPNAAFPIVDSSGAFVAAFTLGPAGTLEQPRREPARVGTHLDVFPISAELERAAPLASLQLATQPDIALAYQAVASLQPSASIAGAASPDSSLTAASFLFLHPQKGRMVRMDALTGTLTLLASGSIAAAIDPGTNGYFLTTPRGLSHQRLSPPTTDTNQTETLPEARVLAEAWVARATTSEKSPFILFGPAQGGPAGRKNELAVTAMQVVPPEDAAR